MAERRADFEKQFRNVWATGPTGVSLVQLTIEDKEKAEDLISKLFYKTLVADVEQLKRDIKRTFLTEKGHEDIYTTNNKLFMLTSDDRVAELIEEVAANDPNSRKYPSFDLIVTPLATGSVEYIQWVKDQTLKKDPEAAFFNKAAPKAMQHDATKVTEAKSVEKVSVRKFVAPKTPSEDDLIMSKQQLGSKQA